MLHHHHHIASALALTAALAVAAPASATLRPDPQANVANANSSSSTIPCTRSCVQAGGQPPAAELGFNRSSAAQAPAAQLGFKRSPAAQAPAAQLGFNDSSVGQGRGTETVSGSDYPNPIALATKLRTPPPDTFDWGDAGIGAGGALGVTMLAVGTVLFAIKARQRPTRNATQPSA
jgi:hypothetical protein